MSIAIGDLLRKRAALDGDWPALIGHDRTLTFSEFNAYVNRTANALTALSVRPGDRVAVVLRNSIEFCALYYASAKLGAILCCVNWRLAAPEIAYILRDSGATIIVFDDDSSEVVGQALMESPVATLLRVGRATKPGANGTARSFEDAVATASDDEPGHSVSAEAPLALCYTSGTTGRPKGAVLTHSQMFWVSTTTGYTFDYRRRDVNLIATPMFHVGGLSFTTMFVHRGARAVLMSSWNPEQALGLIQRHGVHHFFAVPTMSESLLLAAQRHNAELSSVRWILSGGAAIPGHLVRAFADRGIPLLDSYGCTETAGAAVCMDLDHFLDKPGSIGKPFMHTDVRVMATHERQAGPNEIGEIQIRAPHVFAGYWNNPTATKAAFDGDWLLSGDLGRCDGDGYIYLVDRKKHMIISGGENIYPAEIEQVLGGHPAIAELAVVSYPSPKWGEGVGAVVVLRPGHSLSLEDIGTFCLNKIANYKVPTRLKISPHPLRRTVTGKLIKADIRMDSQE
jgi:fatty-acyl-CoA synthase